MIDSLLHVACYALVIGTQQGPPSIVYGYTDLNQARSARDQLVNHTDAADEEYNNRPEVIERRKAIEREKVEEIKKQHNSSVYSVLSVGGLGSMRVVTFSQVSVITASAQTCEIQR